MSSKRAPDDENMLRQPGPYATLAGLLAGVAQW